MQPRCDGSIHSQPLKLMKPLKMLKHFLRSGLGIEIGYAKYFPRITDTKIYAKLLGCATPSVIFDVGANIGQTAEAFSKSFPMASIYSFEPFEENFFALRQTATKIPHVHCVNAALTNSNGTETFWRDLHPNSEWNSLEKQRQAKLENSGKAKKESIQLIKGDDFCKQEKISQIDILKTDTEGHDLAVLEGFAEMLDLNQILIIVIEVGFLTDVSHTNFQDVNSLLCSKGYKLAGFYETCYFEDSKCEFSNALFVQSQLAG
jgi:FkbM family methyltransferase